MDDKADAVALAAMFLRDSGLAKVNGVGREECAQMLERAARAEGRPSPAVDAGRREVVARIIDPRLANEGWCKNFAGEPVEYVRRIALAKADAILALPPALGVGSGSVGPDGPSPSDGQGPATDREVAP